jgi:hypothetical protein
MIRSPSSLLRAISVLGLAIASVAPAVAMSVIPPTFTDLVAKSEVIARVRVIGTTTQWDTTPTGKHVIHTYVECAVLKQLKGPATAKLSLRMLGGKVDGMVMKISDMPEFKLGETDVVFVAKNGRAFCPLVGIMHGKYSVSHGTDGMERVRRNNGAALRSLAEIPAAMPETDAAAAGDEGMSANNFEAAIDQEVRHASVR